MARRNRFESDSPVDPVAITPDSAAPVAPRVEVKAPAPAPVMATPSPELLAKRAAIVTELEAKALLKVEYEAAKAVYANVCLAIEEAKKLELAKSDAWDTLNRAQIAHDHAQPRVRELTKALEALSV